MKSSHVILILLGALLLTFLLNLSLGSYLIPPADLLTAIIDSTSGTERFILMEYRLPKAIIAIAAGAGLSLAGLLMQLLFRNPLAGPFALGITSGSGLGVALVVMGGLGIGAAGVSAWSVGLASILGSLAVLILILLISMRIRENMGLLIVGLMVGSVGAAIVGILSYLAPSEQLQRYVFWTLGSLGGQSLNTALALLVLVLMCIAATWHYHKSLDILQLGDRYAQSMGVNLSRMRWGIIAITALITGIVTALIGPIAFVGLAVPHLARLLFRGSRYLVTIPIVCLCGSILLLLCDIVAQVPGLSLTLPINAITSLVGAPVVIWLLLCSRKLNFS